MTTRTAPRVSTKDMHYHKETRTLVTEASTIGYCFEKHLKVESHHTGQVRIFEQFGKKVDRENEITVWYFRARSDLGLQLHILND